MTRIIYRCWCVGIVVFFVVAAGRPVAATQVVFLDFDTGNDGSVNYTPQMRSDIVDGIQLVYDRYDILIQQSLPSGPFSRITFNEGFAGGVAEQIDFRNLDPSDNALVNVSGLTGINTTSEFVASSITIGAHELGHLLGFRHGDSFGPIGSGIGSTGPSRNFYQPAYPGPAGGVETVDHVMASPGSVNVPLATVVNQHWLSERSATKLQFAESGTVINEAPGPKNTLATAQPITLPNLTVPNTIVSGQNAGLGDFSVDALSVLGNLGAGNEVDFYEFEASQGDLFNIEVMSGVLDRIGNSIDPELRVLDANGSLINYYGSTAFNDDEFETNDSILIDLIIPDDGTYYMQVNAFSSNDTGSYELFAYRFNGEASLITGDFDGDGDYACEDVNQLIAAILTGLNDPNFDLSGDGLVDENDLDSWLAEAGAAELASGNPYLRGDANLNGTVDGIDYLAWNENKFTSLPDWCGGDFNADGIIDGLDFLLWNDNKFTSADVAAQVPEPTCAWLLGVGLVLMGVDGRTRQKKLTPAGRMSFGSSCSPAYVAFRTK